MHSFGVTLARDLVTSKFYKCQGWHTTDHYGERNERPFSGVKFSCSYQDLAPPKPHWLVIFFLAFTRASQ